MESKQARQVENQMDSNKTELWFDARTALSGARTKNPSTREKSRLGRPASAIFLCAIAQSAFQRPWTKRELRDRQTCCLTPSRLRQAERGAECAAGPAPVAVRVCKNHYHRWFAAAPGAIFSR